MKEKEIEIEGDRQFQKVSLPPLLHEASPLLIRLSRKRGRERGGTSDCKKSACTPLQLQDRILEVQQRRGVPSLKHKTGTAVLVLTSHLPGASSKSIGLTDQASFLSTDTVITTKKLVLFAERNRQRVPLAVDLLRDVDEGRRVVRAGRAPFSCWRGSLTALA